MGPGNTPNQMENRARTATALSSKMPLHWRAYTARTERAGAEDGRAHGMRQWSKLESKVTGHQSDEQFDTKGPTDWKLP